MKKYWTEDKKGIIAFLLFSLLLFVVAIFTDGTCDSGDSVGHYLFAKYAIKYQEIFVHHWAKPFYILVMFPFAQLGFIGVKLFNTFLSCVAIGFTYLIAKKLKFKYPLAVFPIALFFRMFTIISLSGLTEPLFNCMFSIALYLAFSKRFYWASILVSFLPFVRSEGLFVAGSFSLYLLLMKQWKALPLLALGHIVYSIAGYPFYHNLWWVFTNIPYAQADGHYGSGSWDHYLILMPGILGVTNTFLLTTGILITTISTLQFSFKKQFQDIAIERQILVVIFLVFLILHSIFWTYGIFGSFGLTRVFIAIATVMILIALPAIDFFDNLLEKITKYHKLLLIFLLLATSIFAAIYESPYRYSIACDFSLGADQVCEKELAVFVKANYPNYKQYHFHCEAPYLAEVLGIDLFDENVFKNNDKYPKDYVYPDNSFVIWDDWYSRSEHNTSLEKLENNTQLEKIKTFEKKDFWGNPRQLVLFKKRN